MHSNEGFSGWNAHINTRKLNWYISTITDIFLNQKKSWRHLYCVFTYAAAFLLCVHIHLNLLIEKDICDCRNSSVELPCVYVCLSSEDLSICSVRVSSSCSYFCVFRPSVLSFSTWYIILKCVYYERASIGFLFRTEWDFSLILIIPFFYYSWIWINYECH